MGDARPSKTGWRLPRVKHRGKLPQPLLAWGLGAGIGHNNGPPLDDETPGYLWRRYRWQKAHAAAWKPPSMGVLKFRMKRAEAAGLSYHDYTAGLLDSGRFAQARDRDHEHARACARLRTCWREVLGRAAPGVARMPAAIVLASLTGAYAEARRAYHNAVHIAAVLDAIDRHGGLPEPDMDAVRMAALFHDVVYDATRTDNEMESARVARLHLRDLGVGAALVERIAAMIEATRHRPEDVAAADSATALLLDCDLAVLAAPDAAYRAYAAAVRREYAHVPDATFFPGRARVLRGFLARPHIFASEMLRAMWEAPARANVAAECDRLATQRQP